MLQEETLTFNHALRLLSFQCPAYRVPHTILAKHGVKLLINLSLLILSHISNGQSTLDSQHTLVFSFGRQTLQHIKHSVLDLGVLSFSATLGKAGSVPGSRCPASALCHPGASSYWLC